MRRRELLAVLGGVTAATASFPASASTALPPPEALPWSEALPDPLTTFSGYPVRTPAEWRARRSELKRLFQHYMYGYFPRRSPVRPTVEWEDAGFLDGKATLREVTLRFGPAPTPPLSLLVALPNGASGGSPAFLGLNFCGNHAVVDHPRVRVPDVWMYPKYPGVVGNRATEAGRGKQQEVWNVEETLSRGYAFACVYNGDIDPDVPDFTDGVHPHFRSTAPDAPGPHDWGTIAAWAWGLHRCVDYLVTEPRIDRQRIAVVGHSRNGKTALLAGAFDERIALAIAHQAGCGGTAPSRGKIGESVQRINTSFPHWFNDTFPRFNACPQRLPFDQHCLAALMAPRPVLFSNATEDTWANPDGQFEMLRAAEPVYQLLGVDARVGSVPGQILASPLGYFIRLGQHSMTREDWSAFWLFADRHLTA